MRDRHHVSLQASAWLPTYSLYINYNFRCAWEIQSLGSQSQQPSVFSTDTFSLWNSTTTCLSFSLLCILNLNPGFIFPFRGMLVLVWMLASCRTLSFSNHLCVPKLSVVYQKHTPFKNNNNKHNTLPFLNGNTRFLCQPKYVHFSLTPRILISKIFFIFSERSAVQKKFLCN